MTLPNGFPGVPPLEAIFPRESGPDKGQTSTAPRMGFGIAQEKGQPLGIGMACALLYPGCARQKKKRRNPLDCASS